MMDRTFAAWLVFASVLAVVVGIASVWRKERSAERSRLPGALAGDDPSVPFEPSDEPIFDQLAAETAAHAMRNIDLEYWLECQAQPWDES